VQSNMKKQLTVHIREIGLHKQELVRWCLNVCVTVVTRNGTDSHQKKNNHIRAVCSGVARNFRPDALICSRKARLSLTDKNIGTSAQFYA